MYIRVPVSYRGRTSLPSWPPVHSETLSSLKGATSFWITSWWRRKRRAYSQAQAGVSKRQIEDGPVGAPASDDVPEVTAAAQDSLARAKRADRPLDHVAGHVVEPERAPRRGVRADLVRPHA